MTEEFHTSCKELASPVVYLLPSDETDKCQHVDQGEGYLIKKLMGNELDKYLEKKDNLERWQSPSALTASERRILFTQWLGQAWQTTESGYAGTRRKLFKKTGSVMTADGSDDDLIRPEGFPDYSF